MCPAVGWANTGKRMIFFFLNQESEICRNFLDGSSGSRDVTIAKGREASLSLLRVHPRPTAVYLVLCLLLLPLVLSFCCCVVPSNQAFVATPRYAPSCRSTRGDCGGALKSALTMSSSPVPGKSMLKSRAVGIGSSTPATVRSLPFRNTVCPYCTFTWIRSTSRITIYCCTGMFFSDSSWRLEQEGHQTHSCLKKI